MNNTVCTLFHYILPIQKTCTQRFLQNYPDLIVTLHIITHYSVQRNQLMYETEEILIYIYIGATHFIREMYT